MVSRLHRVNLQGRTDRHAGERGRRVEIAVSLLIVL